MPRERKHKKSTPNTRGLKVNNASTSARNDVGRTSGKSTSKKFRTSAITGTEKTKSLEQFLDRQREIGLLRFITCGSVDDGKSTLIGRLLWESHLLFEDQIATLEKNPTSTEHKARRLTLRCWWTVLPRNVNKA